MADIWFWFWRVIAIAEALLCVVALAGGALGVAEAWSIAGGAFGEACVASLLGWPELQPRPAGSRHRLGDLRSNDGGQNG